MVSARKFERILGHISASQLGYVPWTMEPIYLELVIDFKLIWDDRACGSSDDVSIIVPDVKYNDCSSKVWYAI